MIQFIKKNKSLCLTLLIGFIFFSTIAFVNHFLYRTFALDLGLYTHAMFEYAHGRMATTQLFLNESRLLLSDHFDLYLIILSPLIYVFQGASLLVIQIVAILFGALGVYKYMQWNQVSKQLAWLGTFIFLFSFGVFGAVAFEYHSNVLSVSFIPWWILSVVQKKRFKSFLWLIILWIGKENFSFFLFFLSVTLAWNYRFERTTRNVFLLSGLLSLGYFLILIKWLMPALAGQEDFVHFGKYPALGGGMTDAFSFMLHNPVEFVKLFFVNHLPQYPELQYEKLFFYVVLIAAGGWAFLVRPIYLIAIAPLLLQKMCSNQFTTWGTSYQYNIEFAPLLAFAVIDSLLLLRGKLKIENANRVLTILCVFLTIASSMYAMVERTQDYEKSRVIFWQKRHFKKEYDVNLVKDVIKKIPRDASVMATSSFVPHLACRSHIYTFPLIKDSEYILLSGKESSYPLSFEEYEKFVFTLHSDSTWEMLAQNDVAVLFKRRRK
jgi:uncharacterized membrane protein